MLAAIIIPLILTKVVIVDDVGLSKEEIQKIKDIRSNKGAPKKIEIRIRSTTKDNGTGDGRKNDDSNGYLQSPDTNSPIIQDSSFGQKNAENSNNDNGDDGIRRSDIDIQRNQNNTGDGKDQPPTKRYNVYAENDEWYGTPDNTRKNPGSSSRNDNSHSHNNEDRDLDNIDNSSRNNLGYSRNNQKGYPQNNSKNSSGDFDRYPNDSKDNPRDKQNKDQPSTDRYTNNSNDDYRNDNGRNHSSRDPRDGDSEDKGFMRSRGNDEKDVQYANKRPEKNSTREKTQTYNENSVDFHGQKFTGSNERSRTHKSRPTTRDDNERARNSQYNDSKIDLDPNNDERNRNHRNRSYSEDSQDYDESRSDYYSQETNRNQRSERRKRNARDNKSQRQRTLSYRNNDSDYEEYNEYPERDQKRTKESNMSDPESKYDQRKHRYTESDSDSNYKHANEGVEFYKANKHKKQQAHYNHSHGHGMHRNVPENYDEGFDDHSSTYSVNHYPFKDPRLMNHTDPVSHVVETAVVPPTVVHPNLHDDHADDPHHSVHSDLYPHGDPHHNVHSDLYPHGDSHPDSGHINIHPDFHHADPHGNLHSDPGHIEIHPEDPNNHTSIPYLHDPHTDSSLKHIDIHPPENSVNIGFPHNPVTFLHEDLADPNSTSNIKIVTQVNKIIPENIHNGLKETTCPIIVLPNIDPKIDLVRLEKTNLLDANRARSQILAIKIRESVERSVSIDQSIKELKEKFNTLEQTLEQRKSTSTSIESNIQVLRNKKNSIFKNQNDLKTTRDKVSAEYRLLKNNLLHLCKEMDDLKQKAITKEQEQGIYEERIKNHITSLQDVEKNLTLEESRSLEYKKEFESIQALMASFQAKLTELAAQRDREQALQNQLDMERERILRSDLGYTE